MFGFMFGDIGHGLTMFLFASFLCLFEPILKEKVPAMGMFLTIRYLLLMMGLFALFNGLIYNDFMAIPLWLFRSCYDL